MRDEQVSRENSEARIFAAAPISYAQNYEDGINRFYSRSDHPDLLAAGRDD